MFVARTGLKSNKDGPSGLTALLAPKRKKKEDDIGFFCWVPFMLGPCIGGFIGLAVLLGGASMCATGYYAKYFASSLESNGTHSVTTVNNSKHFHMHNFTFIGPVIMGCGCFAIVVACVVVCEQRDKEVRVKYAAVKKKKSGSKKNKFYDSVVERLKRSQVAQKDNKKTKDKKDDKEEVLKQDPDGQGTTKRKHSKVFTLVPCIIHKENETEDRQYTHISEALRNIPMEIFTVNMDEAGGASSLLPVHIDPAAQFQKSKFNPNKHPSRKYPSAACIHDLVRVEESKLNEVFPDRHLWLRKSKTELDLLHHFERPKNVEMPKLYVDQDGDCEENKDEEDCMSVNEQLFQPFQTEDEESKLLQSEELLKPQLFKDKQSLSSSIQTETDVSCDGNDPRNILIQRELDGNKNRQSSCEDVSLKDSDIESITCDTNKTLHQHPEASCPQLSSREPNSTNVILCEASIHKEDTVSLGSYPGEEQESVMTSNTRLTQSLNIPAESELQDNRTNFDIEVLALTSGWARANAAGMDGFHRSRSALPKTLITSLPSGNHGNEVDNVDISSIPGVLNAEDKSEFSSSQVKESSSSTIENEPLKVVSGQTNQVSSKD